MAPESEDPMTKSRPASIVADIAHHVLDLKRTELLVLTIPEDMPDRDFERFKCDLRSILNGSGIKTDALAIIVLREGMTIEALDEKALQACGLLRGVARKGVGEALPKNP
jgi:hypothetical protein